MDQVARRVRTPVEVHTCTRLFQRECNITLYLKRLGEQKLLVSVAEQVREDLNTISTFGKLERSSVLRGKEVVVCRNTRFSDKQTATPDEFLVTINPNIEVLMRFIS